MRELLEGKPVSLNLSPRGIDLQSNSKIEIIKEQFLITGKIRKILIKCNLFFYSSHLEQK